MKEEKKQGFNLELRSEKVRSIVGQMPSSLIKYGITIIGVVLICLFFITLFLPSNYVYSGVATVHSLNIDKQTDSTDITVWLKFENIRLVKANSQLIYLQSIEDTFKGRLLWLSSIRDTLDRQEALCRFNSKEIMLQEHQTIDFIIIDSSGNIIQKMLGNTQLRL